jgi:hypothetical protein
MSRRLLKKDFSLVVSSTYRIPGDEQSQYIVVVQDAERVFQQTPRGLRPEFGNMERYMQCVTSLISTGKFLAIVAVTVCWLQVLPTKLHGQNCTVGPQGNNAVYNTTCSGGHPGIQGSPAFIDASVFLPPNGNASDICDAIYGILKGRFGNTYPAAGGVIDARGINGAALTCTQGSPWSESAGYANFPSTILLPAGVILIPSTWTLPDGTKIIGAGAGGS